MTSQTASGCTSSREPHLAEHAQPWDRPLREPALQRATSLSIGLRHVRGTTAERACHVSIQVCTDGRQATPEMNGSRTSGRVCVVRAWQRTASPRRPQRSGTRRRGCPHPRRTPEARRPAPHLITSSGAPCHPSQYTPDMATRSTAALVSQAFLQLHVVWSRLLQPLGCCNASSLEGLHSARHVPYSVLDSGALEGGQDQRFAHAARLHCMQETTRSITAFHLVHLML